MPTHHNAQLTRQTEPNPEAMSRVVSRVRWTGNVLLACHCGHDSGWVEPDTIKDDIYEHLIRPGLETKPLHD
ncbi:hypothetical protein [[Kitasatospora] papulosa]|uniref:hypothetical protein n=1 Tax=[Kitasatospora] papulosa TaxID=1464011 RepID=UPI0038573CEE